MSPCPRSQVSRTCLPDTSVRSGTRASARGESWSAMPQRPSYCRHPSASWPSSSRIRLSIPCRYLGIELGDRMAGGARFVVPTELRQHLSKVGVDIDDLLRLTCVGCLL